MALKRRREAAGDDQGHAKRHRPATRDISSLSDELVIRILSFIDERVLLAISPVSRRFHRLASDSQLWRPHYYRRFILPRAHSIPGFRRASDQPSVAPALGCERRRQALVDAAAATDSLSPVDWKKQYKLRHNWARGRCAVGQLPVHDVGRSPPPESQTLVKVVDGLAVTADARTGLRAWDLKTRKLLAQTPLADPPVRPTCLDADDVQLIPNGSLDVSAGFQDGTFGVWRLDLARNSLTLLYRQMKSCLGQLVAIAFAHPYVLTATTLGFISLYTFEFPADDDQGSNPSASTPVQPAESAQPRRVPARQNTGDDVLSAPHQLTSLKSHSARLPLTLSLRKTATSVVASIVYTFDSAGGWAIGIQDLDIRKPSARSRPKVVNSRVAYTLPTRPRKPAAHSPGSTPRHDLYQRENGPVRLCYSHPYLLATLPDNCMVLHLCTSTATSFSISPGIRLWGHTSGISDAEITPRGRAVSVSTRGDEIRLWELEGRVGGSSSVEVRPRPPTNASLGDVADRRNWVGFDSEMVVVLGEGRDGRESLLVYDFT